MIISTRLKPANECLESFAPGTKLEIQQIKGAYPVPHEFIHVTWERHGERISRRWLTRGQDFYPLWRQSWPGGGTAQTALSQLVRWVRDLPVLPISTWRHWASERCKLLPPEAVEKLLADGYPPDTPCVLCGQPIRGSLDWWHRDKISGPCCGWMSGCCQKVEPKRKRRRV